MAALCPKIYLVNRGDKLNCEKTLIDKMSKLQNIEVIYNASVKEILGEEELEGIVLTNDKKLNINGMFISIGMNAQTKLVEDLLQLSDSKYVSSEDCETNKNNIFVAGDCRDKSIRQLTTAVADGTTAAIKAIKYLEGK